MTDDIWTTRDGREIAVGDMDEDHVRNALRMVLRRRREKREQVMEGLFADVEFERPDNRTILSDMRRRHGDALRVDRRSIAGMDGGNVYVAGQWVGWFGGIR